MNVMEAERDDYIGDEFDVSIMGHLKENCRYKEKREISVASRSDEGRLRKRDRIKSNDERHIVTYKQIDTRIRKKSGEKVDANMGNRGFGDSRKTYSVREDRNGLRGRTTNGSRDKFNAETDRERIKMTSNSQKMRKRGISKRDRSYDSRFSKDYPKHERDIERKDREFRRFEGDLNKNERYFDRSKKYVRQNARDFNKGVNDEDKNERDIKKSKIYDDASEIEIEKCENEVDIQEGKKRLKVDEISIGEKSSNEDIKMFKRDAERKRSDSKSSHEKSRQFEDEEVERSTEAKMKEDMDETNREYNNDLPYKVINIKSSKYKLLKRDVPNSDSEESEEEKEKPNFEVSGLLAKESNSVTDVTLKHSRPVDSRMPTKQWRLYMFKGDSQNDSKVLHLHRQESFLFGKDTRVVDIPLMHPTISKQHAVLQFRYVDGDVTPYILDLESTNGTFVNQQSIPKSRYFELRCHDIIRFGRSSREFVLLHTGIEDQEDIVES